MSCALLFPKFLIIITTSPYYLPKTSVLLYYSQKTRNSRTNALHKSKFPQKSNGPSTVFVRLPVLSKIINYISEYVYAVSMKYRWCYESFREHALPSTPTSSLAWLSVTHDKICYYPTPFLRSLSYTAKKKRSEEDHEIEKAIQHKGCEVCVHAVFPTL
jgi:hypothetical protein